MQRHSDGTLVVSATDLVGFLECDHLVGLELARARGELERPFHEDPQLDLLRRRGYQHEQEEIARLTAAGRVVVEMTLREPRTPDELRSAEAETVAAMRSGTDVIFQATTFDGRWRGHPDFLVRRDDRPSDLGSWSYDVADTKLAAHVRGAALIQMCVYAARLEQLQGVAPEFLTVVTGDAERHAYRYADYAAYVQAARERFEARVFEASDAATPPTYPEPVGHCDICPWWTRCMDQRRADDHLSIVAGATRVQRRKLVEGGVTTRRALADLEPGAPIAAMQPRVLDRLRRQAALQVRGEATGRPHYELLEPTPGDAGRGLAALPPPSPLDLFFDLEADHLAMQGGLEYLWGWVDVDGPGAEPAFHVQWAHDRAAEKAALESFVDLVMDRLRQDPGMHVYHYGAYESGALKRLMQRHATREDEIDALLRGKVLVNLYDHVVRQALLASVESYSIKRLEPFYMPEREGGITNAGFSIVEYERWIETQDPEILEAIAAYNRDDCLSNLGLRNWLESLRVEALATHPEWYPDGVVPRPGPGEPEPAAKVTERSAKAREREDALRAGIPADAAERSPDEQARWLLAGLVSWHRREAKPQWWDQYRLREGDAETLFEDPNALAGLQLVEELGTVKTRVVRRYAFDPRQDTRIDVGSAGGLYGAETKPAGVDVVAIDPLAGTVDLKDASGKSSPRAIIPNGPYNTDAQEEAIGRVADQVIASQAAGHAFADTGPRRAARELVARHPPRFRDHAGGPLRANDETALDAARRLGLALDGTVLAIQGPPGTGKTYTAARMILDLVRAGRVVGITAQSHRVIGNALKSVAAAFAEAGEVVRLGHRSDDETDIEPNLGIERIGTNERAVIAVRDREIDVLGGTSWLWSRLDMEQSIDVLFVDEAGQFSLANTVAVAGAADSLVLLGDPNQLPQVSTGVHPEGAAASALEHLIGDARTIAPDRGLLLDTTWRLHPDVNAFISPAYYDGRVTTEARTARQRLAPGAPLGGTGVRFVPVAHEDRGNRAPEEAAWVIDAIASLIGRPWVDALGRERPIELADMLVVAPYNAQVAEIRRQGRVAFGTEPNAGTVDLFQGREAPVAIYSMATSSPDDAPRDLEFLYSGNRLNVAISRAQGLAALVANPDLFLVACRTPEQMRLLNGFHLYLRRAAEQEAGTRGATPPAGGTKPGPRPGIERPTLGL